MHIQTIEIFINLYIQLKISIDKNFKNFIVIVRTGNYTNPWMTYFQDPNVRIFVGHVIF